MILPGILKEPSKEYLFNVRCQLLYNYRIGDRKLERASSKKFWSETRRKILYYAACTDLESKEIADKVCLSDGGVKANLTLIYRVLQVKDRCRLIIRYYKTAKHFKPLDE